MAIVLLDRTIIPEISLYCPIVGTHKLWPHSAITQVAFFLTLKLSAVVPGAIKSQGDSCQIRQFRHTDFSTSVSPVVLVDHFVMTGPAFGPHSHAGISAATLLLDDSTGVLQNLEGAADSRDVRAGDLYWAQTGRGLVHAQRPVGEARLHGLQIFMDLPGDLKTQAPSTSLLRTAQIPVIQSPSGRIRVVSGQHGESESPLRTPAPLLILDGQLRPGATTLVPLQPGWNAWITAIHGDLGVRARHCRRGASPLPKVAGGDPDFAVVRTGWAVAATAQPDGEEGVLLLMAGCAPSHFVLIAGPAVDLPVAGQGMPAQQGLGSLEQALAAYQAEEAQAQAEIQAELEREDAAA